MKPSSAGSSTICTKRSASGTPSKVDRREKLSSRGCLDRDVRHFHARVVPNVKRETLQKEVLDTVKYGTKVYTDEAVGYDLLHYRFVHEIVNHSETYVKGRLIAKESKTSGRSSRELCEELT